MADVRYKITRAHGYEAMVRVRTSAGAFTFHGDMRKTLRDRDRASAAERHGDRDSDRDRDSESERQTDNGDFDCDLTGTSGSGYSDTVHLVPRAR